MEDAELHDTARLARDCAVMTQAVALSRWISDTGPRPVTPRQVLSKPDLPSAAEGWHPPIWRTVLLPATASLSTLHRVVQILYGWDGDHLHAFRVRRATYSDPSFGLEDARSEYHMAVQHALAVGGGKIVYEYDFGAGWTHEIALQKKLPRDRAAVYPVCARFSGDSPVEYPEEELWYADEGDVAEAGPAKPEPFDLAAVNRKLAALASR